MTRTTSERHTDILNGYKAGGSRFNEWAEEHLGVFELTHWEWGEVNLRWDIDDRFVMPDGVMFGGHIASVADHVAGLTAMTVLIQDHERFRTSRLENESAVKLFRENLPSFSHVARQKNLDEKM